MADKMQQNVTILAITKNYLANKCLKTHSIINN